ncbi:calcium release-activated calcium channel protein 1-like [Osmerus eperlanus]|uniref:calcium release-activated calcium channel protein 1-like n=1 Tax=Osmerus eperlanus TaxID=29151 RepID=UPI002E14F9E6
MSLKEHSEETLSWRKLHLSRAKLKAISQTSAFMAGFAMVAMVEMDLESTDPYPRWLLVAFSACTTTLVAVHLFALVISTCLLPHFDALARLDIKNLGFESPQKSLHSYVEAAWILSTVVGTLLSLVEVVLVVWIKFLPLNPNNMEKNDMSSSEAAITSSSIMLAVGLLFIVFAVHFYYTLVVHKTDCQTEKLKELDYITKIL